MKFVILSHLLHSAKGPLEAFGNTSSDGRWMMQGRATWKVSDKKNFTECLTARVRAWFRSNSLSIRRAFSKKAEVFVFDNTLQNNLNEKLTIFHSDRDGVHGASALALYARFVAEDQSKHEDKWSTSVKTEIASHMLLTMAASKSRRLLSHQQTQDFDRKTLATGHPAQVHLEKSFLQYLPYLSENDKDSRPNRRKPSLSWIRNVLEKERTNDNLSSCWATASARGWVRGQMHPTTKKKWRQRNPLALTAVDHQSTARWMWHWHTGKGASTSWTLACQALKGHLPTQVASWPAFVSEEMSELLSSKCPGR